MNIGSSKISFALTVSIFLGGCLAAPPVDFTVRDVGMVGNRKNAVSKWRFVITYDAVSDPIMTRPNKA